MEGVSNTYSECLEIYELICDKLFGGELQLGIWMMIKGVAVSAILLKWMWDYYHPIVEKGEVINPLPNVVKGLSIIFLIAASNKMIYGAELLLRELEMLILGSIKMPESTFGLYSTMDGGFWEKLNFMKIGYDMIRLFILMFIIVIDFTYFLGRICGLIIFGIMFPITLTLSIFSDDFKQNLVKQIKILFALYLSGPMYLIAIWITLVAFEYLSTGPYKDWGLIALLIVLFSKKVMFSKIDGWAARMFA